MMQCLELLIDWRHFVSGWLVMANTCHYWQMTGLWCSVWSCWLIGGDMKGEPSTVVWLTCDGQHLSLLTDDGAMVQCLELLIDWRRFVSGSLVMANTCHYWQMTGLWCCGLELLIDWRRHERGTLDCCVADLWWPTLVTIDRWRGYGAVFGAADWLTALC